MGFWWNDTEGKTEKLGENPAPMILLSPQIPRRMLRDCMLHTLIWSQYRLKR
jgi:hypothetical protein